MITIGTPDLPMIRTVPSGRGGPRCPLCRRPRPPLLQILRTQGEIFVAITVALLVPPRGDDDDRFAPRDDGSGTEAEPPISRTGWACSLPHPLGVDQSPWMVPVPPFRSERSGLRPLDDPPQICCAYRGRNSSLHLGFGLRGLDRFRGLIGLPRCGEVAEMNPKPRLGRADGP